MDVKLQVKDPILRNYLSALFELRDDGRYAVTMDSVTGAAICTQVVTSDYPHKQPDGPEVVQLELPHSRYTDCYRGKFLRISDDATARINAVLRREFDMNFYEFVAEGRAQGFKLRDIIAIFIVVNHLDNFDGDIETMKKRYYRHELEIIKKIEQKLAQKAYCRTKLVAKKITQNIID